MRNYIIGTHDSVTGESSKGFLSWLVTPFAKTQDRTIKQQFANGVRYFDIRLKKAYGTWHCGHGLWTSKKTAYLILSELNELAEGTTDKVYVSIAYEGKIKSNSDKAEFIEFAQLLIDTFTGLNVADVAIKLPTWTNIGSELSNLRENAPYPLIHLFKTLDYSSWHTYFPCPRFWNMFYREEPQDFKTNLYDFY